MEQNQSIRWHLFDGYKLFRLEITRGEKVYHLGILHGPTFHISNRWVRWWTEKFATEVHHGHWDHYHAEAGLQIVFWSDWWDADWKAKWNFDGGVE